MALSFSSVEKAYEVFHELKSIIPLSTPSFPEDMAEWTVMERKNPLEYKVYGYEKKYDNGWENLIFFVCNPSDELKQRFDELKSKVPNSSMSHAYTNNDSLWIFGWF